MFSPLERLYLEELKKRNFANEYATQTKPLEKPMTVMERKLRSSIRRKCKFAFYEIALAQVCGVIPDKEMKEEGMNDALRALNAALWMFARECADYAEMVQATVADLGNSNIQ